jgi:hypothetical protein
VPPEVYAFIAAALPPCPTDPSAYFHNCEGIYTWADGRKYVGEWRDDLPNGQGTYYCPSSKHLGHLSQGPPLRSRLRCPKCFDDGHAGSSSGSTSPPWGKVPSRSILSATLST